MTTPGPADGQPLVVFLLPYLRCGGAEVVNLTLAEEFLRRGVGVELWVLSREGPLLDQIPDGVELVDLGVSQLRRASGPIAAQWRKTRPAAVLASVWPLTVAAAVARKRAGAAGRASRLVVVDHGMLSRSPQARGAVRRGIMRSTIAGGYRLADAAIGVSRGVAEDVRSLGRLPDALVHAVPNPAASGVAKPASEYADPWPAGGPRVLCVGTLRPEKDHATLLRAWARRPDGPRRGRLCVLGAGPGREEVERLTAELGLGDSVWMAGHAPDPAPYYAHADLFVLSSRSEGFGNVVVEALEFGLPVVCTDCEGPAEIVDGGRFGRLVPVGDDAALADAIGEALADDHNPERSRGRAAEYSIEKAADRYLELLLPDFDQRPPD